MKRIVRAWLFRSVCAALVLMVSLPASGGPLDRKDYGIRYNPAADNMIRVPGVIGLSTKHALAVLQRHGLTPRLEYIRKPSKDYKGMEGTVVDQLPLGGGVAMYGSSVTVTVYDPGSKENEHKPKP